MSARVARLVAVALLAVAGGAARADAPSPTTTATPPAPPAPVAAAPSSDELAAAQKLFDSGVTHYNLGEFDLALKDFKEAYRVHHDPAFLYNVGQAYRQLGDAEHAAMAYRAFLREAPKDPKKAAVEKFIADADAAMDAKRANLAPTEVARPSTAPAAAAAHAAPTAGAALPELLARHREGRQKSRTWLWVTVGVVGAVLVGAAVGVAIASTTSQNGPGSYYGTLGVSLQ